HAVIGTDDDLVLARGRRQQLAGPAHAEVVARERLLIRQFAARRQIIGRRPAIPTERDARIDPGHRRRTCEVPSPEVLALQSLLLRVRLGSHEGRVDQRDSTWLFATFDEIRAARIKHLGLRTNSFPDALQDRYGRRWRAVVIAEQ